MSEDDENDENIEKTNWFSEIEPFDLYTLGFILLAELLLICCQPFGVAIPIPDVAPLIPIIENSAHYFQALVTLIFGLLFSEIIKYKSSKSGTQKNKYWGYTSILCFSLFGSVMITVFTSEDYSPFLVASGFTLAHIGFWTWKYESIAKNTFNKQLENSVSELDGNVTKIVNVLDTMPEKSAFEISLGGYAAVRHLIASLYQYYLPTIYSETSYNEEEKQEILGDIEIGLKTILTIMCSIARSWTKGYSQYFESNIMLLKTKLEVISIDENQANVGFDNGLSSFKRGCTLEIVDKMYAGLLEVDTSLVFHTKNGDYAVDPILLPVGEFPDMHGKETIPGAPAACENNEPTMVADIMKIADELHSFSFDQRKQVVRDLSDRGNFQSIVSFPLPFAQVLCQQLEIKNELNQTYKCMGVINLYRHEKGGVKDVNLMYNFCAPLLYIASDLLIFRSALMKNKPVKERKIEDGK